jgi:hypothetical protein
MSGDHILDQEVRGERAAPNAPETTTKEQAPKGTKTTGDKIEVRTKGNRLYCHSR